MDVCYRRMPQLCATAILYGQNSLNRRRSSISKFMLARTAGHALSKPPRPIYRFRGCLKAKQEAARVLSRPATAAAAIAATSDDADIIALFDHPQFAQTSTYSYPTGIFGHGFLTAPSAFNALAESTLRRAELLTKRILRAQESREELFKVVKNLDRLSDMLCGVIDLAELLRNAHPDPHWIRSADEVYEKLCEFMNVLNTNVGLYEVRMSFRYMS